MQAGRRRGGVPATLVVATLLALPPAARAQAAAPLAGAVPEVTVTATRERRQVDETTSTVTVITAEEIDARFVRDIRDLVRNEPGVTVPRAPTRFGAALGLTGRDGSAGFNIRGLEGNRVLIQVDGIRVPAAFQFGASNFGRGGYTEVTTVRAIEILRGPASSLYGSDGLAGVVSFLTFDPADLLGEDRLHASAALAHASEDRSTTLSWRAAARLGAAAPFAAPEVLAIFTARQSGELDNFGTNASPNANRTRPNPQDIDTGSIFARWVQPLSADARIRFTLERLRTTIATDVLSGRGVPPLGPTGVLRLDARDTVQRTRASADAVFERLPWRIADRAQVAFYWQESEARQLSFEDRNIAADRTRDNRYGERVAGVNTQFDLATTLFGLRQRIVYGADHAHAFIDNLRTGTVPPAGETFPTKAFADSDFRITALFAQSEIELSERLFLIPALRHDRYSLSPRSDPLFPGQPAALRDSALTPRLALRIALAPGLTAYAHYAEGFRAPTPAQVNNGFTNLTAPGGAYRSIGNPNLQPERSGTFEVGLRGSLPGLRWDLAVFDGRFRDFIEQITVGGTGTPANPLLFQFVNLAEVRIRGAEGRLRHAPSRSWRFSAGFAWTEGEDSRGRPLNSVQPLRIVAGVEWLPIGPLSIAAFANHSAGKRRDDIDSTPLGAGRLQFAPPSHTVFDLMANLRWSRQLEVGAGVFNLTNEKHWRWPDVQGLAQGSAVLDAFTQPRRSYALRVRATF